MDNIIFTVLPKRSNEEGKAPQASQLEQSEIAVNYNAGTEAIYMKNSENQIVGIPFNISAVSEISDALNKHQARNDNPHGVTKEQVGLGKVDNTPDLEKPLSAAQTAAINSKLDNADNGGVVNDLTTNDSQKALSAAQGIELSKKISEMTGGAIAGLEALEQKVSAVEEEIKSCIEYIDETLDPKAEALLEQTI